MFLSINSHAQWMQCLECTITLPMYLFQYGCTWRYHFLTIDRFRTSLTLVLKLANCAIIWNRTISPQTPRKQSNSMQIFLYFHVCTPQEDSSTKKDAAPLHSLLTSWCPWPGIICSAIAQLLGCICSWMFKILDTVSNVWTTFLTWK